MYMHMYRYRADRSGLISECQSGSVVSVGRAYIKGWPVAVAMPGPKARRGLSHERHPVWRCRRLRALNVLDWDNYAGP